MTPNMATNMATNIHFISAGAGSGKTYRLTQMLHAKLAAGALRPAGIIATTFTQKAATELRERVRTHLLEQGEQHLANAIGKARIGTVNSVCGSLLKRFAFEAGLATAQQVLEESQAIMLLKQAIDSVQNGPQAGALWALAQRLGIEDWRQELHQLINQARANNIGTAALTHMGNENSSDLLSHFPPPAKTDLNHDLQSAIAANLPELTKIAAQSGKKNSQSYLAQIREVQQGIKAGNLAWSEWIKLAKTQPEQAAQKWAEPINTLAARVAEHPRLQADLTDYLTQMFNLCAQALANYAERKRELGALDLTDQEQLLLNLLAEPQVAETLKAELDLLMVDEFQDTSPIQLALFLKLAEFARETIWVGDIKQAIYGFRGSDTALMRSVLHAVRESGAPIEILSHSWRSRPQLVRLINHLFIPAMANELPHAEIELQPKRTDALQGPFMGNWLLAGKNKQQETVALALGVQRLLTDGSNVYDKTNHSARPIRKSDIAILSRQNDNVDLIARSLRELGIATATTQPGLLATPEAILAMACLRRLNDTTDTVATAEIISLADCAEPESWLLDRLNHLQAGGDPNSWRETGNDAHPMLKTLAMMRADLPVLAPREALQQVIIGCDLPSHILRWKQDAASARKRLANLEALLELAQQYENNCRSAQHAASIPGLILWLKETAEAEQDGQAQPAIDAVKVMTHHAAKGLEWPVVILTDLNADLKNRLWGISAASRHIIEAHTPLKDRTLHYWPWPFGKHARVPIADQINQSDIAQRYQADAIEEAKRLLYVSMTRARDYLIIARSQRKPTGEWLETLGAAWLLPAASDQLIQLPNGETLNSAYWQLDPTQATPTVPAESQPLYTWPAAPATQERQPLSAQPSSAKAVACTIAAQIRIGERIAINNQAASRIDMAMFGSAIHACIAAAITDPAAPLNEQEASRILNGHSIGNVVTAQSVQQQINALEAWITQRWPEAKRHAEIPIEVIQNNGQILHGRIDLLLELAQGWIVLDHKANPQGPDKWLEIAQAHAGQLFAYGNAITQASGKPVLESWLYFPVSGGAVRIEPEK